MSDGTGALQTDPSGGTTVVIMSVPSVTAVDGVQTLSLFSGFIPTATPSGSPSESSGAFARLDSPGSVALIAVGGCLGVAGLGILVFWLRKHKKARNTPTAVPEPVLETQEARDDTFDPTIPFPPRKPRRHRRRAHPDDPPRRRASIRTAASAWTVESALDPFMSVRTPTGSRNSQQESTNGSRVSQNGSASGGRASHSGSAIGGRASHNGSASGGRASHNGSANGGRPHSNLHVLIRSRYSSDEYPADWDRLGSQKDVESDMSDVIIEMDGPKEQVESVFGNGDGVGNEGQIQLGEDRFRQWPIPPSTSSRGSTTKSSEMLIEKG